ncbi:MAG: hypothetical protein U0525_05190 [Patescibacteria group bacterium]
MQRIAQKYGLTAAILVILVLAALAMPSAASAAPQTEPVQAEYAVAVDTSSQNWKAVRLDNGQQPKSDDPRLINQTDGLVEFRAQDMGGNYIEAWTLEEVAGDWQIEQINGNKFYHFAVDATRAWIMNDRIMACSELERVSKGNKKCPVTPLYLPLVKR